MAKKADPNSKLIAENRRARFDYAIEDTLAGLPGVDDRNGRLGIERVKDAVDLPDAAAGPAPLLRDAVA